MTRLAVGLAILILAATSVSPHAQAQSQQPTASPTPLASTSPSPPPSPQPSPLPSPSSIPVTPSPSTNPEAAAEVLKVVQQLNDLTVRQKYGAALAVANRAVELTRFSTDISPATQEKLLGGAAKVYYRNGLFSEASQATESVANLRAPDSAARASALYDVSTLQRLDGRPHAAAMTAQSAHALLANVSPTGSGATFSVLGFIPIIAHYVDFFDREVPSGYGRYSYVLFPVPDNAADFISALRAVPDAPNAAGTDRLAANVFELPTLAGHEADAQAAMRSTELVNGLDGPQRAAKLYDYKRANIRLLHACREYATVQHRACDVSGKGPYVVVYAHPAALDENTKPYLIVDLSNMHRGVYPHFITKLKRQVARAAFAQDQGLKTLSDEILSVLLTAADCVDPAYQAVSRWVRLVGR